MQVLKNDAESIKDQWVKGNFTSDDPNVTQVANVSALGQLKAIEQLLELDHDQLVMALEEPL